MTAALREYRTRSGRVLTSAEIDALADEVDRTDYDVADLKTRDRDRRPTGRAPDTDRDRA